MIILATLACDEADSAPPDESPQSATLAPTPSGLASPVAAGERILSIDITMTEDSEDDEATAYDTAVGIIMDAGATATSYTIYWDEFEPKFGKYAPVVQEWLELVNLYYPYRELDLTLNIAVVDMTHKRVPSDLMETPFDSPEMIARFNDFLDQTIG